MPPGAPYHSFIQPYPIRVDAFATPEGDFTPPALHLLTHTHTDHINGLSSLSFGGQVVCSEVAKEMLLRYEPAAERVEFDLGKRKSKLKPCSHLRIKPTVKDSKPDFTFARDLLVNEPAVY
jgi:glyoxylase-like metal-dependent hydrolase (beta-lactamase superfamily II)